MSQRFEIRPGEAGPGKAHYATHDEVLVALKATAKQLGLVAKLPAGKHGEHWKASIDGLVIVGDIRKSDDHKLETFFVTGETDHDTLITFAEHIATIAGKQAVIGETDDEFWFVEAPKSQERQTMRTLIKGGTVVMASDTFVADVLINDGKIAALFGSTTSADSTKTSGFALAVDQTIDATGKFVIPGGIDCHTHMEMPFGGTTRVRRLRDRHVAAAHGGTTTIVDFAIQSKGSSLRAGLDAWHAKAEGKAAIDYGFHMIMTEANASTLEDMAAIVREGVTSFKMFMAYPGVFLVDDQQIFKAMLRAGELGALITMHAEIGLPIDVLVQRALPQGHTAPIYHALTRPEVAEATGTERAIALAEMAKVPVYMVHLSARARARARDGSARPRPAGVRGDVSAISVLERGRAARRARRRVQGRRLRRDAGAAREASPRAPVARPAQLRSAGRRDRSLSVLHEGSEGARQRTTSRRSRTACPASRRGCTCCGKACTQGKISMNRFVEITSTAPAKIFGMYGKKGTLAVGADADVVVWDPNKREDARRRYAAHAHRLLAVRRATSCRAARRTCCRAASSSSRTIAGSARPKQGRGQFVRRGTFSL